MDCSGFTLDASTPLAQGHELILHTGIHPIDAGEYSNVQVFHILDQGGENKTENYSLFIEEGMVKITPKPIFIVTESGEWEYDDQVHELFDYVAQGILENHQCEFAVESIRNAGCSGI